MSECRLEKSDDSGDFDNVNEEAQADEEITTEVASIQKSVAEIDIDLNVNNKDTEIAKDQAVVDSSQSSPHNMLTRCQCCHTIKKTLL